MSFITILSDVSSQNITLGCWEFNMKLKFHVKIFVGPWNKNLENMALQESQFHIERNDVVFT